MPDVSTFLSRPAGEAQRRPALAAHTYPGIISGGPEYRTAEPGKDYEQIIRFQVRLTGWPEQMQEEEKSYINGKGERVGHDLSKARLRKDFFDSDDGLVFLDRFIRSCGIDPKGRSYAEILPQLLGARVKVEVGQYMNNRTNEIGNQINNITGEAAP